MREDRESLFSVNGLVRRIHRKHVVHAAVYARGMLLDVGCGRAPYRDVFSRVDRYVGLDRRRGSIADVYGDGMVLPFREGCFDTVFCSQALEHVPEPSRMMGEMVRVLKKGGILILTAPHMWGIHEEPRDYFRFTSYGLAYLAQKSGLEGVTVRPMAGYWVTAGARLCYYVQLFERGILIPLVRLLYGVIQWTAWGLDRFHRVEGDAWNFILVGRKAEGDARRYRT